MKVTLSLQEVKNEDRDRVGGKGYALAAMSRSGIPVPEALCVTVGAYRDFVAATGIAARLHLELERKRLEDMRWEEIWDAALRIRNLFLSSPIPGELRSSLEKTVESAFSGRSVVVRSSAPGEDSAEVSFAGLHESYVNVRGTEEILQHLKLVWASLWSDRALLYRRELGLETEQSAMAVVVQEIVLGERSGVAFGRNPAEESQAVIEAVHGLNQGLVDGTVEPDRWILDRYTGRVVSHRAARREKAVAPADTGVLLKDLPPETRDKPPLAGEDVAKVFELVRRAEALFGAPQDVEWTFREQELFALQSRPITALKAQGPSDSRPWYFSLRRSFENLRGLRQKIEEEILPAMEREAGELAATDFSPMDDAELAAEVGRRADGRDRWIAAYWKDCIPFAHGMRLFGEFYNDAIRPADPYEFVDLLSGADMISLKRNRMIEDLAAAVRSDPALAKRLKEGALPEGDPFLPAVETFIHRFGDLTLGAGEATLPRERFYRLILEMAGRPVSEGPPRAGRPGQLEREFLSRFPGENLAFAEAMLDLGRASYRLRDDDNMYLGKIEAQLERAASEGRERLERRGMKAGDIDAGDVARALADPGFVPVKKGITPSVDEASGAVEVRARQIVGQPAGPGIAIGLARVVREFADLFEFKAGEILVCDALEPEMTFVIPLAAGIVERRGGMLIHGAIIAREYGIACVTGVPGAVDRISTGDRVTVDGYLGIVVIDRNR